jgi:hypothetical protein
MLLIAGALLAGLAVTAAVLAVIRTVMARTLGRLEPAFELGTARVVGAVLPWLEGVFGGYRVRYRTEPSSNNSPGAAVLELAVHAPAPWSAARWGTLNRALVRLGVLEVHRTGDADLDRACRFAARDRSALMGVFSSDRVRGAARGLVSSENFSAIEVRPDRVRVRWVPRSSRLDDDPEHLRRRLGLVTELLAAVGYPPSF